QWRDRRRGRRASQRQLREDSGAVAGLAAQTEAAAELRDALLHAEQAESARASCTKTLSVVLDDERHTTDALFQRDPHAPPARVARAVAKRFLRNSKNAGAVRVGQVARGIFSADFDRESRAVADFTCLPFERGDEAEIIEHRRPQREGDAADG